MNKTKIFPSFWQALLYNYVLPIIIGIAVFLPVVFINKDIGIAIFNWSVKFNDYAGHIFTIPILLFFLWKSKIKIRWAKFTDFNIKKILIIITLAIALEFIFHGTIYFFEKIFNRDYSHSLSNSRHYLYVIHMLVMAPIIEEILYRRIFLHQFLKQYPVWVALALSSFLFAIPHIPVMYHFELFVPYFISGLFLGLIYYKTQSITLCIISHFIMNLMVMIFPFREFYSEVFTMINQ
ncbi:MAG: CPBP family intramembrane metalloprotease [Dysgonamonadaceae bacterium]|jgi:membrane protease YdiL (CAAX protease family)|nr:CPBP family intramembrane metalloprotease [Dysgonamonadaceae bacterium]